MNITVGCIYRSPLSSLEDNDNLCKGIRAICEKYKNVVFICDFNFPAIKWLQQTLSISNPEAAKFLKLTQKAYLFQHINRATCYRTNNQPSNLDLLFSSKPGIIQDLVYMSPLGKSDHLVIQAYVPKKVYPSPQKPLVIYNKGDYSSMSEDLSDWNCVKQISMR